MVCFRTYLDLLKINVQRAGMTAMPSTETVLDKPVFVNLQLWQRFKVVTVSGVIASKEGQQMLKVRLEDL